MSHGIRHIENIIPDLVDVWLINGHYVTTIADEHSIETYLDARGSWTDRCGEIGTQPGGYNINRFLVFLRDEVLVNPFKGRRLGQ